LYAVAEPAKFDRAVVKWLARYLSASSPSLLEAQIAAAAMADLRTGGERSKRCFGRLLASGYAASASSGTSRPGSSMRTLLTRVDANAAVISSAG
jgi:hypothetical protein